MAVGAAGIAVTVRAGLESAIRAQIEKMILGSRLPLPRQAASAAGTATTTVASGGLCRRRWLAFRSAVLRRALEPRGVLRRDDGRERGRVRLWEQTRHSPARAQALRGDRLHTPRRLPLLATGLQPGSSRRRGERSTGPSARRPRLARCPRALPGEHLEDPEIPESALPRLAVGTLGAQHRAHPKLAPASRSAPEWIRTTDLWLRRPTLYPAELRARIRQEAGFVLAQAQEGRGS